MKKKSRHYKSSLLVSIPFIIILFFLSVLLSLISSSPAQYALFAVFLIMLISRVTSSLAIKKLNVDILVTKASVFPPEDINLILKIENDKPFIAPNVKLYIPLQKNGSVFSDKTESVDQREKGFLIERGYDSSIIGICPLGSLKMGETREYRIALRAIRRGVFKLKDLYIETSDLLSLSKEKMLLFKERDIVIFPRLLPISLSLFLQDISSTDTAIKGYADDVSVLRSSKAYESSDSIKAINWRLLARSMPLSVNIYEKITAKRIHIILDGESFSGIRKHKEEMEDAISAIAYVITELEKNNMKCYLSLPSSRSGRPVCIKSDSDSYEHLYFLAIYDVLEDKLSQRGVEIIEQDSVFDLDAIKETQTNTSSFFFFTYALNQRNIAFLNQIEDANITVISFIKGEESVYRNILINDIKGENENA